ncbi:MAG: NADH-quinone oxidoreductase subunit J [Pirellulales bacterium]|nr:NADH-quinone oxidoreductase subunit J [Pirellulales bacterium]
MKDSHTIWILATLLGSLGLWLMLPRGGRRGRLAGAALAVVALGLAASQTPRLGTWTAEGIFAALALVTVVAAAAAVTCRNPVYCAIWFGLTLLGTAGLFLLVGAQFLAAATVVVYAGAILVTFLFVLMLAQPEGKAAYDRASWEAMLSAVTGVVLIGVLSITVGGALTAPPPEAAPSAAAVQAGVLRPQHVAALGTELFGRHLIAIQIAGTLLLTALVGAAVIIAQGKNTKTDSINSKELKTDEE